MTDKTQKLSVRSFIKEILSTLGIALFIAFTLRTFLFQAFHIPSGSMEPTLYNGDYIITTKYSLGYGKYAADPIKLPIETGRFFERKPSRGDVIVFKPVGSKIYFIKRLVGLPGERIQMIDGFLYVNGSRLKTKRVMNDAQKDGGGNLVRTRKYLEYFEDTLRPQMIKDMEQNSAADNTGVYTVPMGHYFFMGDNRDNSYDSRFPIAVGGVGYVPATNLVGRAEFILLSVNNNFRLSKPWTWLQLRRARFFKGLR